MDVTYVSTGAPQTATALAALGVVAAAFVAGYFALRSQRKTLLTEVVTKERSTWRSELRQETAKLSAIVVAGLAAGEIDAAKFNRSRVGILLRLNPAGRRPNQPVTGGHEFDRIADACLRRLALAADMDGAALANPGTRDSVRVTLRQLEHAIQELLKQEWEVSKREAVTGRLKKGSADA